MHYEPLPIALIADYLRRAEIALDMIESGRQSIFAAKQVALDVRMAMKIWPRVDFARFLLATVKGTRVLNVGEALVVDAAFPTDRDVLLRNILCKGAEIEVSSPPDNNKLASLAHRDATPALWLLYEPRWRVRFRLTNNGEKAVDLRRELLVYGYVLESRNFFAMPSGG